MTARILLCLSVILALVLGARASSPLTSPETQTSPAHPNVLVIITDDQRWDTLHVMPKVKAWLQDNGVTFTNSFAHSPICCPNRATFFTGQYVHHHGVFSNMAPTGGAGKLDDTNHLGVWLQQQAGYRTGLFGKWLNEYQASVFPSWPHIVPGFDQFSGFLNDPLRPTAFYTNYTLVENGVENWFGTGTANHSTNVTAERLRQFIAGVPADEPFFAVWAPFAPHSPHSAQTSDTRIFDKMMFARPPSFNEADVSDKPIWIQKTRLLTISQIDGFDSVRRRYMNTLVGVDRQLDLTMLALQSSGRLDDTIVIFTSDNGYTWGEHRLVPGKACAYEECIRVPLVIRTPQTVGQPRTDDRLVATLDLAATIADYAGATPALPPDGLSLRPLLEQTATAWRDDLLIEHFQPDLRKPFNAVRTNTDIYVELLGLDLISIAAREYYDLVSDPYQLTNRLSDPAVASRVQTLRDRLAALRAQ